MSAANNSSGRCFTSICYSADGAYLLAGGNSKFVCLYDVEERVLLRRFRIANSRALDGVLDQLSSKHMTDAVRRPATTPRCSSARQPRTPWVPCDHAL
jgi:periodic tryptophan protein 2